MEAGHVITVKEEFLTHEKLVRAVDAAGYEALAVWLAIKSYCAQKLTDGFIPTRDTKTLKLPKPLTPRALQKAIDALVECGDIDRTGQRGAGLLEIADGGYQMHDYLDHSNAREEIELRREKARIKKQRQRDEARRQLEELRGQREGHQTHVPEGVPARVPRGQPKGQGDGVPEGVPGHVPLARPRARSAHATQPSPAQPLDQPDDVVLKTHQVSRASASTDDDDDSARVPRPSTSPLTEEDCKKLEFEAAGSMPRRFIDIAVSDWLGLPENRSKKLFPREWRTYAIQVVRSAWRNDRRRREILAAVDGINVETTPEAVVTP
jgi:hypothetical protein